MHKNITRLMVAVILIAHHNVNVAHGAPKVETGIQPFEIRTISRIGVNPQIANYYFYRASINPIGDQSNVAYIGSFHGGYDTLSWYYVLEPEFGVYPQTFSPLMIYVAWETITAVDTTIVDDMGQTRFIYMPHTSLEQTGTGEYPGANGEIFFYPIYSGYAYYVGSDGSTYYGRHDHKAGTADMPYHEALNVQHLARQARVIAEENVSVKNTTISYHNNPDKITEILPVPKPFRTGTNLNQVDWTINFRISQTREIKFDIYLSVLHQAELVRSETVDIYVADHAKGRWDLVKSIPSDDETPFIKVLPPGQYTLVMRQHYWPYFGEF